MVAQVVVAPMVVALATAVVTLFTRNHHRITAGVSLAGGVAYAAAVAALVAAVLPDRVLVYRLGDITAPVGIVLVADALSAFMLALTAAVVLPALAFSVRSVDEFGQRISYHALFHFMLVGVSGAFLTGDLFNLFVWFEVMLMASYALVAFYGGPEQTRAGLRYVVLNLAGSAVMLVSIGGLYATLGTLNMADMARRLANAGTEGAAVANPAPVLGLSALLFAVFALKAGLVPFQFWVPAAYRAAPAPVTAVLAGVVKKVGVYATIRLLFTVFAAGDLGVSLPVPGVSGDSVLGFYGPVLYATAVASIAFGGVAATGRESLDDLLAYSSISQIGFIVLPVAVAAVAPDVATIALAAALVYALNHAVAKSMLFLVSGTVVDAAGTDRLSELGGLTGRAPVLSAAFLVGALAMIGIPPLSGFFGKLLVFDAASRAGAALALAAGLGGAVLTIAYMSRGWNRGFWGPPTRLVERSSPDAALVAVAAALALAVVVVGVGFDPVYEFAIGAAEAALDRGAYADAVLGDGVATLHGGGGA